MRLPPNLQQGLSEWPRDMADAWVGELPQRIADAEERWAITIGEPFDPGGVTSYVARATTAEGGSAVYKVTMPHDEAIGEATALELYGGDGAVRLLASRPHTFELLLERCEPGTPLWEVQDREARYEIAASLMTRLWKDGGDSGIRSLSSVMLGRAGKAHAVLATAPLPWVTAPLDRGANLLASLPMAATRSVLLHQDFHPGNVLASEREPWLVIDPKPLVGDPAFEPIQLLVQEGGSVVEPPTHAEIEHRIRELGRLTGVESERIGLWALARCTEWCVWAWEAGDTIESTIQYTWARYLDQIVPA